MAQVAGDEGSESDLENGQSGDHRRRELPPEAVATLKAWLLSPEHFEHPYPSPQDQQRLLAATGIGKKQLKNWFTNARRRIWKPLMKKRQEQTQPLRLHAVSAGGNVYGFSLQKTPMIQWAASINAPMPPQHLTHNMSVIQDAVQDTKLNTSFATTARREKVERCDSFAILESLLEDEHASSDTSSESNDAGRAYNSSKRAAEIDEHSIRVKRQHLSPGMSGITGCNSDYTYSSDAEQQLQPGQPMYQKSDNQELPFIVQVSSAYQCLFCSGTHVDTQLIPCQHVFHSACLREWLLHSEGAPRCPLPTCRSTIVSCGLAVACAPQSFSRSDSQYVNDPQTESAIAVSHSDVAVPRSSATV